MDNAGIEAFLAIVRTRNLSRAAAQLNLAQSTVSKRLKTLEEEIGIPLIERGKGYRSVQLTASGAAFVELAERYDAIWRETQLLYAGGPKLSLTIGILDSVLYSTFPPVYRAVAAHSQPVSLTITTTHSMSAYDEIERRNVDVAFTLLERTHPNVEVRKCYGEEMVVLRCAKAAPADQQTIDPSELDGNAELHVPWGPGFQLWHEKWWDPYCSGRTNVDTTALVLTFLEGTDKWSIVPYSVALRAQASGPFSIAHLSSPPPERAVYLLTHKQPQGSCAESIRIFQECLDKVLGSQFPYLSKP